MEKIKPKGVWKFERSSGYAGYRCQKCNTWIYCGAEAICDCNNSLPIEDTTILSPNEVIKLYRKAYREGYLTPSMFLEKLNELVKEKTTTNGRI
jgi:hypothetical protein